MIGSLLNGLSQAVNGKREAADTAKLRKVLEDAVELATSTNSPGILDQAAQKVGLAALAAEGLAALEQREAYGRMNRLMRNFELQLDTLPALVSMANEMTPATDRNKAPLAFLAAKTPAEMAEALVLLQASAEADIRRSEEHRKRFETQVGV